MYKRKILKVYWDGIIQFQNLTRLMECKAIIYSVLSHFFLVPRPELAPMIVGKSSTLLA